jgi:hypothetical protein
MGSRKKPNDWLESTSSPSFFLASPRELPPDREIVLLRCLDELVDKGIDDRPLDETIADVSGLYHGLN